MRTTTAAWSGRRMDREAKRQRCDETEMRGGREAKRQRGEECVVSQSVYCFQVINTQVLLRWSQQESNLPHHRKHSILLLTALKKFISKMQRQYACKKTINF